MLSVTECLSQLPDDVESINLSNRGLSDDDLSSVAQLMDRFHSIRHIDISDNKFTYSGLHIFLNAIKSKDMICELVLSHNWLFENSPTLIQNLMLDHKLQCLRMCNIQLNEKSILRLCGLKVSQIEELYLDDNSIGNQGLQFLLTSLLHNKSLRRLHLRNNDISDPGVSYLCDYLDNNSVVEYVDIRHNTIYKHSSIRMLQTMNSDYSTPRIEFNLPELHSETHSSSIDQLLINKPFKDACIVFQMLYHILHIQGINAPLSIPRELVFNTTLSSHRRIIRKLLEQPSTLSRRIQWLSSYLMDDKVNRIEKNHVLNLILDHIPLINLYLLSTPILKATVTSIELHPQINMTSQTPQSSIESSPLEQSQNQSSESSVKSSPSEPSEKPSPPSREVSPEPDPDPVEFINTVEGTIPSTIGQITRAGIVKIHLVKLLESVVSLEDLHSLHTVIMYGVHSSLLKLFSLHPLNNILHEAVTQYFETALTCNHPSLNLDMIGNCGLAHFVITHIRHPELDHADWYRGYLARLALSIQHVYGMNGSLFFSLYECDREECLNSDIEHPITRKNWEEFVRNVLTVNINQWLIVR